MQSNTMQSNKIQVLWVFVGLMVFVIPVVFLVLEIFSSLLVFRSLGLFRSVVFAKRWSVFQAFRSSQDSCVLLFFGRSREW